MALSAAGSALAGWLNHGALSLTRPTRQTRRSHMLALEPSCKLVPLRCQVGAHPRCVLKQRTVLPYGWLRESQIPFHRGSASLRQGSKKGVTCSHPETSTSEVETHKSQAGVPSSSGEPSSMSEQEDTPVEPKKASKDTSKSSSSALSSLDSYFQQLAGTPTVETPSNKSGEVIVQPNAVTSQAAQSKAATDATSKKKTKDQAGLSALDAYFDMLNPPKPPEPKVEQPPPAAASTATSEKKDEKTDEKGLRKEAIDAWKKAFQDEGEESQETLDLAQKALESVIQEELSPWNRFLDAHSRNGVNTLAALSVAVYLFELASPQAIPGNFATSLPNLFGAKVNELIAQGEWWRLFTPSLLHAGFFHICISVWTLLLFGPQVEAAYGTTSFVLLYFLTGAFGNLMSFGQTPDATIGGTGPLYGLVGAWLVFLIKNREVIGKEKADNMSRQAIFLSALNVALGNPLPIDDWTHIGAALGGLLYGALAAPTLVKKETDKGIDPKTDETFKRLSESIFGGQLDYKVAVKTEGYILDREALDYRKLLLSTGVSLGLLVALVQLGTSGDIGDMNVLPSLLNLDNVDFL